MEKYLGQEFADTVQREQFLRDNADAVENIGYAKDLPSEAVEKLKEKLAQATIKKMAVEDEKKEANKEFNDTIAGYKAKIDHEIELSDDKRGNTIAHRAQVVQSNIPQSFDVHMPIFKGGPETVIPVSIEIRPTDLACTLVSIEAEEHFKESRDKLIDEQVNAIRDEADDILIIEK